MIEPYYQSNSVTLYQGSCLDIHPQIESQSVDFILTDLPYGVTACSWDRKLPLDRLWQEWKRIIKPRGAIALFGTQPFTSELVMSSREWFKYEWIWEKDNASNFGSAKYQPMRYHEGVLVFAKSSTVFNPQMKDANKPSNLGGFKTRSLVSFGTTCKSIARSSCDRYPSSIIRFDRPKHNSIDPLIHPTQKPIALLQYLIRTYTNEGDTVLDSTCGSGSTLVAAQSLNRKSIGIELDSEYCAIAASRLGSVEPDLFRKEREATGQYSIFDALEA